MSVFYHVATVWLRVLWRPGHPVQIAVFE